MNLIFLMFMYVIHHETSTGESNETIKCETTTLRIDEELLIFISCMGHEMPE